MSRSPVAVMPGAAVAGFGSPKVVTSLRSVGSPIGAVGSPVTAASPTGAKSATAMGDRAVVVGGGLAGLSAVCELLERGCNVTLLEKEENLGGISSKATCGIAVPGSFLQKQAGIVDEGKDLIDSPAAQSLVQKGPQDFEWLTMALGVREELILRHLPGHGNVARAIGTKEHFPGSVITYAAIHVLQQVAKTKPDRLSIISGARVTNLVMMGTRVVGVQYSKNGVTTKLNGPVILAAGGYAGDRAMTSKFAPRTAGLPAASDERSSGDAIKLGQSAGAAVDKMDQVQVIPTGAVIPGQETADLKLVISDAICGVGGKLLDATGKRFCDERANSQMRVDAMNRAKGPFRLAISEADAQAVSWLCEFYTNRKIMKKYSSVGQLASDMRVSPAVFGADLGNGAVYVAVVTPTVYSCGGGLSTGWDGVMAGKVLSQQSRPIDGLFAAGEATAAPFPKLWNVAGIPLLYSIHSGRKAGQAAAGVLIAKSQSQDLHHLIISSLTAPSKLGGSPVAAAASMKSEAAPEKPLEELSKEELIAKIKDFEANGVPATANGSSGISMDEVKKHNTKDDAWLVINGDVIDVTTWIPIHPGGEQAIVAYLGMDASDEWNMIHKPGTVEKNLVEAGGKGPIKIGPLGSGAPAGGGGGGGAVADSGLSMDEVKKHNTEKDAWVVVNGRAYDVTKWTQVHPGGVQAIMAFAGQDASDEWNAIHKPGTIEKNAAPGNPNGPVDMGAVSGVSAGPAPTAVVDDEAPPPEGSGCMSGPIGAVFYAVKAIVVMLLKTIFFTGNFKFSLDNNRKGTIRSACMLLAFTIIHVAGNFVGMIKGADEANGEGYFFDRLAWTGGLGIWKEGPIGLSIVEMYLALALALHVTVALKRSWDISMNYVIVSGRWNMLLSGLTILFFLTVHLTDIKFSPYMQYTELRPPPHYVAFDGVLEGRVFYETSHEYPLVRVRDLYTREVELFKDLGKCIQYTVCICVFWCHMLIGWKKLVPSDAMQIPKDHVKVVTMLGWAAATAIVGMYTSVVWYTYFAPPEHVRHVPGP